MAAEHLDIVIIGAGLSGIGAAAHLQTKLPGKSYAILEARGAIGGTWDLFRYPGIRSDSDMYTLGYAFKPWAGAKAIADGPAILRYIEETAAERGIGPHIRFGHRLISAQWSSGDAKWHLTVEAAGETRALSCNFLIMCSGYYAYAAGHRPHWPGEEDFRGRIVHPQFWPEDLNYRGKKVAVIGSGATAVTLVPELAKAAAHVTMVQRSPTYIVSRPSIDSAAEWLKRKLPARLAYRITRWKNVLLGQFFYQLARKRPEGVKRRMIELVRGQLGEAFDPQHFTPAYNPWDQRVCLVPDGDLFSAIGDGRAAIVTGTIDRFTETSLRLASGEEIEADLIVAATGLEMEIAGGVTFSIDGAPVELSQRMTYKGMMLAGVPNLVMAFGYTNASWTLKVDLTFDYLCRLLARMDAKGATIATPRPDPRVREAPFLTFTSTYVQRALGKLPKQGTKPPWRLRQNYFLDLVALRFGRVEDGVLELHSSVRISTASPISRNSPNGAQAARRGG